MKQRIIKSFVLLTALAWTLSISNFAQAADLEAMKKSGAKVITNKEGKATWLRVSCEKWTEADFRDVSRMTELKRLSLSGKTITDKTLPLLAGLNQLESLSLNNSQLTDAGYKHFQVFPKLKQLSIYHPSREMKDFNGSGLKHLKSLKNLRQLTFAGAATGDAAMKAVSEVSQLESYSQWHNYETAAGMKNLLKLKRLKSMRLGQRLYSSKLKNQSPSFGNATFTILSQLQSLESLEVLEARLNYSAVIKLKSLPNLKRLKIHTTDISAEDVQRLKKELPNIKIDWKPLSKEDVQSKLVKKLKI